MQARPRPVAEAGITDVDVGEAIMDEHVRTAAYQRIVSVAVASRSRTGDQALVATILRDPVEISAKTAVVYFIDEIAVAMSDPAEFRRWSDGLLTELGRLHDGNSEFIRRRIRDWVSFLRINEGYIPTSEELDDVTNWMQRRLAEDTTSLPVLTLLATSGRTRKIRNIACQRIRHSGSADPRVP